MSDYFTAYNKRMIDIDQLMKNYAEQFKQLGCDIYHSNSGLINFIKIIKDGKHCIFGFTDFPYQFYISIEYDYNKKSGSGRTVLTEYGTTINWTPEFIISHMVENPKKRFSVSYLKQY